MSDDLMAIVRCAPLAAGWPGVFRFACLEVRAVVAEFDRTIVPMIDQTVEDPERNREATCALLSTSLKVSLAMSGYAIMADVPFNAELAVLGSSFTRVYDDLFDNFNNQRLDERLADLFKGESFQAMSAVESLLLSLYRAIETAIDRPRHDPIYAILSELHAFQCLSRRQLDPQISWQEVRRITRGKGGLGTTVLFALLQPDMSTAEQGVLMELGDILQLLDDYHDQALDRLKGVVTNVTLGACTLANLGQRIRELRQRLNAQYAGANCRRLLGLLYLMLVGALIRRRNDARRRQRPRPRTTRQPRRLLFARAENVRPGPVRREEID